MTNRLLSVLASCLMASAAAAAPAAATSPGRNGPLYINVADNTDPQDPVRGPVRRAWLSLRLGSPARTAWTCDEGGPRAFACSLHQPDWSPDGRTLVGASGGLWLMNHDGTGAHEVVAGHADVSPAWSPDGRSLAFVRNKSVYTVRADETNLRRLTPRGPDVTAVDWSSRDRLAYAVRSTRPRIVTIAPNGRRGRTAVRLRFTEGTRSIEFDWAPDGRRLVLRDAGRLFVADSRTRRVRSLRARGRYPRWSPDGRLIAYIPDRKGSFGPVPERDVLETVRPDGTAKLRHSLAERDSGYDPAIYERSFGVPAWRPQPRR